VNSDSDLSEECERHGNETFIQAEGTIVPPDIQQYVNRKIATRSETEQLNYLSEISQKLSECLKKINKYDSRGEELLQQIRQKVGSSSAQQQSSGQELHVSGKAARKLRRRYHKYLVNSHRKYIDVGNLIARKFENKISSTLKRQFLLVESEFSELSQVVESRGIEVRKKIESIEIQIRHLQEISFFDEESHSEDDTSTFDVFSWNSNENKMTPRRHRSGERNLARGNRGESLGGRKAVDDDDSSGSGDDGIQGNQFGRQLENGHRMVAEDEQFIASEDDLTTTATQRSKLHKRQKLSDQNGVTVASPLIGLGNEMSMTMIVHQETSSSSHHRQKKVQSFDTHKVIEAFQKLQIKSLRGDLLYTSDPESSIQFQQENRILATSRLNSLLEQTHDSFPMTERKGNGDDLMGDSSQIISTHLIPKFFSELCSVTNRPHEVNDFNEFLSNLFMIEVIWQQYAIRNDAICLRIFECADQLEQLLLRKFFMATATSEANANCYSDPVNIFAFLRRKALWIRLMTHVHTPLTDGRDKGTMRDDGNGNESLKIAACAEEKLWSMIIYVLLHSGTGLITSLLQCLQPHSTTSPQMAPLVSDLLITLATLTSTTFHDSAQLASTAYRSVEEVAKSQINISLWSIVNFHLIQSLGNLQTENSIFSFISFYEMTSQTTPRNPAIAGISAGETYVIPAFLGSNLSFFPHQFHRIDSSLWATILLFTWIQSKQHFPSSSSPLPTASVSLLTQQQSIGFASLPSNWSLLKELTKDLTQFSPLTDWLLRICHLLPLWDNSSNGYDLFRDLLSRLEKLELPWCLPNLSIPLLDLSSLQTEVLLITQAYQSHLPDISGNHSLISPLFTMNSSTNTANDTTLFVSPILLDLFNHLCSSIGIAPPRYHLRSHNDDSPLEFGEEILPFALALFSKGLRGIPKDSISFKRIQNRLRSALPLLCKDTSSLSAPICFISLVKCSVNLFGPTFYTTSMHQTLINLTSNEEIYSEEERFFFSWYLSLVLFLPSQSESLNASTSSLCRLGFSFLFNKFQSVLEQLLSGTKTSSHSLSQIVTLISLLPIIDGIHTSDYSFEGDDSNENKIRLIFSLWNGTLRTMTHLGPGSGNGTPVPTMDSIALQLCFSGLQRLFSNLTTYLTSRSVIEVNR
jgi:hypothetical protein